MLTLEGIVIQQDGFELHADITLSTGSITAILGPSGAGKSTLLNVIAGYLAPVKGRILWHGADVTALPPSRRPVAMLFQDNTRLAPAAASIR